MPFGDNREQQEKARQDAISAAGAPQPADHGDSFEAGLEKALTEKFAEYEQQQQAAPQPQGGSVAGSPPEAGSPSDGGAPPPAAQAAAALTPQDSAGPSGVAGSNTPSDPILEALRSVDPNLASKYTSGEEALKGFAHAQQYLGQKTEYEQLGQFVQSNPYAAYERLRSVFGGGGGPAGQTEPAPQAQKPAPEPEKPLEFDPYWLKSAIKNPQTGQWEDLPGAPPGAAQSLARYEREHFERQRRSLEDPLSNPRVQKAIEEKYVSREEFSRLAGEIQQSRNQQTALATVNRLSSKIFVDPQAGWQGGSQRTAWGDMYVGKLAEAGELGIGYDAKSGTVNYDLQNRWAEQQTDLLYAYTALAYNQQQAAQPAGQQAAPVQAPAPQRKLPPSLAGGGNSVPAPHTDAAGLPPAGDQDRLEAMLSRRLQGALERGEIAQSQLSAFSR